MERRHTVCMLTGTQSMVLWADGTVDASCKWMRRVRLHLQRDDSLVVVVVVRSYSPSSPTTLITPSLTVLWPP